MNYRSEDDKVSAQTTVPSPQSVMLFDMTLRVRTSEPIEFVDLTDLVNRQLRRHEVESGAVTIFSRHTTAAVKINEAEELLLEDFKHFLRRLAPLDHRYNHNDMSRRKPPIAPDERPNAHSHLMHLLLSTSETIPVADSRLALGTWQRVFLIELDGPREREVHVRCQSFVPYQRAAVNGHRQNGHRNSEVRVEGFGSAK